MIAINAGGHRQSRFSTSGAWKGNCRTCGLPGGNGSLPPEKEFTPLARPIDLKIQRLAEQYISEQNQAVLTESKRTGAVVSVGFMIPSFVAGFASGGVISSIALAAGAGVLSAPIVVAMIGLNYFGCKQGQKDHELAAFLINECMKANPSASDEELIDYISQSRKYFVSSSCPSCYEEPNYD